jgi:curved DNA-binding protein CbpA
MVSSDRRPRAVQGQLPDYYAVLGVPSGASAGEIGRAYWRLSGEKRDQLPLLNHAYEVLSHPDRRFAYDAERQEPRAEPDVRREPPQTPSPGLRDKLSWYLR